MLALADAKMNDKYFENWEQNRNDRKFTVTKIFMRNLDEFPSF